MRVWAHEEWKMFAIDSIIIEASEIVIDSGGPRWIAWIREILRSLIPDAYISTFDVKSVKEASKAKANLRLEAVALQAFILQIRGIDMFVF